MMSDKKQSVSFTMWARPTFTDIVKTHKKFKSNFHGAMMYAHYELSASDLKKEVTKYLKHKYPTSTMIDKISDMNENRFTTVGKYM